MGLVALVFTLTVASLLTANAYRSGPSATVRSETLERALAKSRLNAQDPQAVAFARDLDQLARRAYFNSLTFRQTGMLLLVAGLLVTAVSFGIALRLSLVIPDPRTLGGDDPARADRLAVNAVLATGIALLAGAVALHLPHRARHPPTPDRELRAKLKNPDLKPGEEHICPCRKGTQPLALAAQWPFLRGPSLSGRAVLAPDSLPSAWNGETGLNIAWKTKMEAKGSSAPVVWNQHLFLTTGDTAARAVVAYDTASGNRLWRTEIPDGSPNGEPLPDVTEDTGLAASSPACDEHHVYAIFATGDLVALDHAGKIVWQRYLGRPKNSYGHASSLVYCGEMLIVQWDQEEQGRIWAFDTNTGKTIWETPRAVGMSWSTPLIMPLCDRFVLLVHAKEQTWGMELATGKKLWQVEAVSGEVAPSLAWENDVWLAANSYSRMIAFKLQQQGVPQKLWEWDEGNLPDVSSPVISDGLVYLATDSGEVMCHQLSDGKPLWHREFDDGFYASPIVAGDKVFVVDREKGVFRVFATGREERLLASNPMGDPVSATPAFAGNRMYVRGKQFLWCIGKPTGASASP